VDFIIIIIFILIKDFKKVILVPLTFINFIPILRQPIVACLADDSNIGSIRNVDINIGAKNQAIA
jgi:hypothetical protein